MTNTEQGEAKLQIIHAAMCRKQEVIRFSGHMELFLLDYFKLHCFHLMPNAV